MGRVSYNIFGTDGGKCELSTEYYISSQKMSAQIFALKIQQHWGIENQVH